MLFKLSVILHHYWRIRDSSYACTYYVLRFTRRVHRNIVFAVYVASNGVRMRRCFFVSVRTISTFLEGSFLVPILSTWKARASHTVTLTNDTYTRITCYSKNGPFFSFLSLSLSSFFLSFSAKGNAIFHIVITFSCFN